MWRLFDCWDYSESKIAVFCQLVFYLYFLRDGFSYYVKNLCCRFMSEEARQNNVECYNEASRIIPVVFYNIILFGITICTTGYQLLLFKFWTFSIVSLFINHYVSRDGSSLFPRPPLEASSIYRTHQSRFTWGRGKSHPSKRSGL
jgi:hypothetical protein